ncbi:hypothetical protein GCM10023215_06950 [Pseudonocardia yuanmonensis]|uniref:STAS domain-containing protein n=1 Tax=Pseudonocardia yuanmonensis TaxID=1095914 RepID=A0ABP8VZH7_9PSEU
MEAWERSLSGGLRLRVLRTDEAVVVLALAGEIDLANCTELDVLTAQVAADPTVEDLVVDLTDVGFLAACGVRCLVRTRNRASARHRRMLLVVAPDAGLLRRVLTLVDGFEIVDSLAEAGVAAADLP